MEKAPPASQSPSAIFRLNAFRSPWQDRLFLAQQVLLMLVGILFLQTFSTLPLSLAHDYGLREDAIGNYLGIYSMAFSISRAVSPIIGLATYEYFGPKLLWTFTGIAVVLVAASFLLLDRREKRAVRPATA